MNDTYVKETVQKEIRSSALTSQDLQLSEDSSDEDVEEKEKRKQKRQGKTSVWFIETALRYLELF